jgi:hypothetical protein
MMARKKFAGDGAPLLLAFLALAARGYGAIVACDATAATSVGTNANTAGGITIAAGGTPQPDDFNTLSTIDTGCASGNIAFSNLAATSGSAATTTYLSTLANQSLSLTTPVFGVFSAIRGTDNSGTDGGSNDDVNNWNASASGTTTINNRYEFTTTGPTVAYFAFMLEGQSLGGAGLLGVAGTITGDVYLCIGANFTASTSNTCSGTLQTIALVSGTTSYAVQLTMATANVGVLNNIVLAGGTGVLAGATYLTAFDDEFEVSPEPSTFILLGSALAGLAALRLRKRSQS